MRNLTPLPDTTMFRRAEDGVQVISQEGDVLTVCPVYAAADGRGNTIHAAYEPRQETRAACGSRSWSGADIFEPNSLLACRRCLRAIGVCDGCPAERTCEAPKVRQDRKSF